jgi:ABC-type transport system substrate-binding protein
MQKKIEQGEPGATPQDLGFVGTGPYKLDKFDAATLVQVRRFDKYWEKDQGGRQMPYLDGIDFVVIKDATAMDAAFRTGRLDGTSKGLGHILSPERKSAVEQALGNRAWFAEVGVTALSTNFNVLGGGPWADARVRRAFAHWMDREHAIKAISLGSGEPHTGLSDPWRSPDWKSLPGFDLAPEARAKAKTEAKRLLAEAGYASGWQETNFTCRKQWFVGCEFVQAQLAGLGIEAPIKFLDEAQWPLNLRQGDYTVTLGGYDALMPENLDIRRATLSPASYTKHEDPAIDAFYVRLADATTQEQRVAAYREMERYVLQEQAYVIPLVKETGFLGYRSHVKGLLVPKLEYNFNNDFATTWLDK